MPHRKIPGETIRKLRNFKGIKQRDAADSLGISQQGYSKLEKSICVKHKKIHQAIKAFGCSNEDFEKLNGYPPPLI